MNRESLIIKLANNHFRKIKSKMLVEALLTGSSVKGNHKVIYRCDSMMPNIHIFEFYYRDTMIAITSILPAYDVDVSDVNAGEYDLTPSTIRQRKDIREAMLEISKVLLSCGL